MVFHAQALHDLVEHAHSLALDRLVWQLHQVFRRRELLEGSKMGILYYDCLVTGSRHHWGSVYTRSLLSWVGKLVLSRLDSLRGGEG